MESESESESESKVEVIKQLMEDLHHHHHHHDHHHRRRLLSKLMAQLELEAEADAEAEGGSPDQLLNISRPQQQQDAEEEEEEPDNNKNISRPQQQQDDDRIVKELKKLKRQNLITHCLLSVMIVLTVAWQISEVSIILKLKDGVTHPFRSIRSMLKSVVKPPTAIANQDDSETSITTNLIHSTPVHDLNIDFPFNAQH